MDSSKSSPAPSSGLELVYGDGGQGLLFLEVGYARDIGDFRHALQNAATWGELKGMVSEERYRETVEQWMETEEDRRHDRSENGEEVEITAPSARDPFDADSFSNFSELEWPEFAPHMMSEWVDERIISEYGDYVGTMFDDSYPLIDFDNEDRVVATLQERGFTCTKDDGLIWRSIFGD